MPTYLVTEDPILPTSPQVMSNLVRVLTPSPTIGAPTTPPTEGLASTVPSTAGLTQVIADNPTTLHANDADVNG